MGCCCSKNHGPFSSPPLPHATVPKVSSSSPSEKPVDPHESAINTQEQVAEPKNNSNPVHNHEEKPKRLKPEEEDETVPKKEIFMIKHRKSHDRAKSIDLTPDHSLASEEKVTESNNSNNYNSGNSGIVVRTSSCTKEEVDAILIQCGRLSRSNSGAKPAASTRRYSGSKRSFDFDQNDAVQESRLRSEEEEEVERRQRRDSRRDRASASPRDRRRRTPSREREREESGKQQQHQRSKSKERSNSTGRRVSRSPGKRSENINNGSGSNVNSANSRPGKMVSVPATVTSLVMDKSNNGAEAGTGTAVKRITVKRNVGEGSRTVASPRSKSPARANGGRGSNNNASNNNNENHQPSLSRSNSRKAEHSPYRRNPLSEIDPNLLAYPQSNGGSNKNRSKENESQDLVKQSVNVILTQKSNPGIGNKMAGQTGTGSRPMVANCATENLQEVHEYHKSQVLGSDCTKPQGLTRTRSARRSRDLDINPESLMNTTNSYTALLLEDIQNFHQKKSAQTSPPFSLPACVTKACSIVEAVADLNSSTSPLSDQYQKNEFTFSSGANLFSKKPAEEHAKYPFLESKVNGKDDLMEPSFEKYVTVQRGGSLGNADMEEQESSGSNSFVGQWGISSSSWEPNSADSTYRWTSTSSSSRSNNYAREQDQSVFRRLNGGTPEPGKPKGFGAKKKEFDHQQSEAGRGGRGGSGRGFQAANNHPVVAAAASM